MTQAAADLKPLTGLRTLVVEDQFLIAEEIIRAVGALGGEVVGPCPTLESGIEALKGGGVDFALLDINLQGDEVYRLAEELDRRGVPFVFATGYEEWALPVQFRQRPRLHKPISARSLREAVAGMDIQRRAAP